MDSLTPDKDDLDRFRQDRKKPAAKGAEPASGGMSATRDTVNGPVRQAPKATAPVQSSAWLSILVLLLVIVVAAISFWQMFRQQGTIEQLQQQLNDANQYINQSKLVIARLEGNLNETEANVVQSGSQLSSRLGSIDAEIRKLWDVANKRNIDLIKESQAKIGAVEASIRKIDDRLKGAEQGAGSAAKRVTEQQARLESAVAGLAELKARIGQVEQVSVSKVDAMAKDNQARFTAITSKIDSLSAAVAGQGANQKVEGRLKEIETAIESIDVSRQQINRRVVDLERRLNEAQLKLNSVQSGAGG